MRKGQTKGKKGLTRQVWTRITEQDYQYLVNLLDKTKDETMCGLLRKMIQKRTVRIYVQDESLHVVMEELAALRAEVRAIGININQITRHFNTDKTLGSRILNGKAAIERYTNMNQQTDRILEIISKLAKKWLSNSGWEKV